jgi:hypothetical protein
LPDEHALVVDAEDAGVSAAWDPEGGVGAAAVQKAIARGATPDDLTLVVDAVRICSAAEGGVGAIGVQKAMLRAAACYETADDVARVVNAVRN